MSQPRVFITGATGFAGFAVLTLALKSGYAAVVSVRKEAQIPALKNHVLVLPYVEKGLVDFILVPDMTAPGVFDDALKGCVGVLHVASPLPGPTDSVERDIIKPAVDITTTILNSALLYPTIRRVVITSSIVAVSAPTAIIGQHPDRVHTAYTRVSPLPSGPYGPEVTPSLAYRHAKVLALDATDRFVGEKKPHFSVVTVHPGYILGRNELCTTTGDLINGSNGVPLAIVLGIKNAAGPRPNIASHIDDVARLHVEALDEAKVPGRYSCFFVEGGKQGEEVVFEDVLALSKREFPRAWEKGWWKEGGSCESGRLTLDSSNTRQVFGECKGYEEACRDLLKQWVELKEREV